MRVLLALSRLAGRAARLAGTVALCVPYALAWVCAAAVTAAISIAVAARLGWQDGRKARHGAA